MKYFDFDIRIQTGHNGQYTLHAESENHGEVDAVITLDPDAADIKEIVRRLEGRETDRVFLETLGSELYQWLFANGIETIFQRSYGEVEGDPDQGLRLRLRFATPELAVLPWELLYSDLDKKFIGTRVTTPLVRYLELPSYKRQLATPYPLRILVVIPHGGDTTEALDADSEKAVIEQALDGLGGNVEATYLNECFADRRVTWQRILEKLSELNYHCFHFIGHGTFDNNQGYLVLDGEDDGDDIVPDHRFAELFSNSPSIKLAVLNACKGATLSSSRSLAGSAARLVEKGVPAVVAMQFDIYDEAAVKFARSFYHSLFQSSDRGRVDVAVSRGRHILEIDFRDEREMAAPVLFMHTANGMLFVPEAGEFFKDLPKNKAQIDTLQAAQEATDSVTEAARFKRRITITKRSVQLGLVVAMLAFFLSYIRVLDIFTIDTRAEFLVMAMGNGLSEHRLSEDLRIVTVDWEESTPVMRQKIGQVINELARLGARTVVLDIFYSAENGEFKIDPVSGQSLVDLIQQAEPSIVVGSRALSNGDLQVPERLSQAIQGLGQLCFESKLGLTRSLPISIRGANGQYPSLALTAFAVHQGGSILSGENASVEEAVVVFPDKASVHFAVSEVNDAVSSSECGLIQEGDQVSHRFIKLTPTQQLTQISITASELKQALSDDPQSLRAQFDDKLVLVGVLGANDIISDLTGNRDGVFWQADAINNLLLDEAIIPLKVSIQIFIMIVLAAVGAALRMQYISKTRTGRLLMLVLTSAVCLLAIYTYGRQQILINPAYHLMALWFAWWLAGRTGRTWLR